LLTTFDASKSRIQEFKKGTIQNEVKNVLRGPLFEEAFKPAILCSD